MEEFKFFKIEDFDCQETGNNEMHVGFVHKLDQLREACGFPFIITSGYRDPEGHSIEKAKQKPGTHAQGIAADIAVSGGSQRMEVVKHAAALGFTGIGVAKSFIHVDIRTTTPVLWCY
jgi:uncharacterized protein YcbK (DUF882 family)